MHLDDTYADSIGTAYGALASQARSS